MPLEAVASFTDAWIETEKGRQTATPTRSHLLQMRGLKQHKIKYNFTAKSRIFYRCVD